MQHAYISAKKNNKNILGLERPNRNEKKKKKTYMSTFQRVLPLLLLLHLTAHTVAAWDIAALRAANTAAPLYVAMPAGPPPMPPTLMPLCGNGRVDTRADYAAYYAQTHPSWITMLQRGVNRTFRVIADEVCDDGNRVDGDGCAADCMAQDAWAPPCELEVTPRPGASYEFVGFVNTTHALALLPDGLRLMDARTRTLGPQLAAKAFGTLSALLLRQSADDNDGGWTLLVHAPGALYAASARNNNGSAFTRLKAVDASMTRSEFYEGPASWPAALRTWLLLMRDDRVTLLSVHTAEEYSLQTPPTLEAPFAPYAYSLIGANQTTLNIAFVPALHVLSFTPPLSPSDTNPNGNGSAIATNRLFFYPTRPLSEFLWTNAMYSAMLASASRRISMYRSSSWRYEYAPQQPTDVDLPDDAGRYSTSASEAFISPLVLGAQDTTPRTWLGNAMQVHMHLDGPRLATRMFVGADVAEQCTSVAACSLDLPLCYDVLDGTNPFRDASAHGTYLDALVRAAQALPAASNNLSALLQRFIQPENILCASLPPVTLGAEHPVTGALWVVRGASIYELGRSGAQVVTTPDGRCASAYTRLPCPPCQWAPPTGGCTPCHTAGNATEGDLGRQQACAACLAPPARRRLLASSPTSLPLLYTVGSNASADSTGFLDALRTQRHATCVAQAGAPPVMPRIHTCREDVVDPQAAMRSLRERVDATGGWWTLVSAPRVVYNGSHLVVPNNADVPNGSAVLEVLGIAIASVALVAVCCGVCLVVVLVCVVACLFRRRDRPHADEGHALLPRRA